MRVESIYKTSTNTRRNNNRNNSIQRIGTQQDTREKNKALFEEMLRQAANKYTKK